MVNLGRSVVAAIALWLLSGIAQAQPIEVLWLGHSAFRITSVTGKVIVIVCHELGSPPKNPCSPRMVPTTRARQSSRARGTRPLPAVIPSESGGSVF